jgi:signal transduction histidine kinase
MTGSAPGRVAQTLGFRLALWYAAIFSVSVLLIAVIAYALLARSLTQRDHDLIRVKLADYAARFESFGVAGVSRAVAAEQASGSVDQVFVRLVGTNAEILLTSMPPSWGSYALEQLGDGEGWRIVPARGAPVRLEVAAERLVDGTILQVGRTTLERERFLRDVRALLSVLLVIVVVVGLVGGGALTWQAFRPVRELLDTLRHIAHTGRLEARVPVGDQGDVLSELSRVSNAMLARIELLVTGMRHALDAVAHDLRTPIARMRGRAEQALLASPDVDRYRAALEDTVEEADRVSALMTTLMDISEAQAGTMQLRREPIAVTRVLQETLDLYEDLAEARGVRLILEPPPADLTVNADYPRLRQALANLVDNAVKYAPDGGRVTVSAEPRPDAIALFVRDTGPGIAEHQQERIWERLYRGEAGEKERGLGLGLSLVRAVVEAHGGRAEVDSARGQGSTFTLVFPNGTPEPR